ncbi:uncharacterized protein LOC144123963 [Amblyomma americanum]
MAVGRIGEYRLGTNASWDEYVERLEMFCEANQITKEEQKRAVLLSSCGEEVYGLIVTLVKPERPTAATYEEIKTAVRKHLHPKPSELYARFLFYRRNQAAEESVADYVTALRKLAEDCGFGSAQLPLDVMMRDRFVCGLRNEGVQQRLLAEHSLTFKVAYDLATTAEATAKQQRDIRKHGRYETDCQEMVQATRAKQDTPAEGSSCYRCNGKHAPHLCRFRKATCFNCKRVGHIAKACRSKDDSRTARKTAYEQKKKGDKSKGVYEMSALFSLCEVNEQEQKFMVQVTIEGQEVPMEVDSGASCSIVSEDTFRVVERNHGKIPLQDSGTTIVTWSKEALPVLGQASVLVEFKGRKAKLPLLVVQKQGNSLIGRNWFNPLGIGLRGIQQVNVEDVPSRFPEVFRRDLPGFNGPPVHIELKDDAQPVFLKSRPVPLALKDDVANEVDRLVQQGVWEPVSYSNWATPLKAQLRVNKDKCEFNQTSIEFLGHRIDDSGVHPSRSKTDAIQQAPAPASKKEVQAFLGLLNFYSSFLKGRTEAAEPLYRLLDRDHEWKWTGPRWKAASVVAVRGPVSYVVQLNNGERHHRHRNQLRSAWTRLVVDPVTSEDYHVRLPPTARQPQPLLLAQKQPLGRVQAKPPKYRSSREDQRVFDGLSCVMALMAS